jgi:hypothetical protein
MSKEALEIVRLFNVAHEGENLIPLIKAGLARLPPDPDEEVVLAWMAGDPAWRHLHRDVEWDVSVLDASPAKGAVEVANWWATWLEVWESYSYRIVEYRDLGAWVITPAEIRLRGHTGTEVELNMFEIWQVREGKITLVRVLPSEVQALEAATVEE